MKIVDSPMKIVDSSSPAKIDDVPFPMEKLWCPIAISEYRGLLQPMSVGGNSFPIILHGKIILTGLLENVLGLDDLSNFLSPAVC